ncbi:MAG: DedA family protein [Acidobacteria bacterium]|nr:DedA family protein [Acidobacteriota bacterium]
MDWQFVNDLIGRLGPPAIFFLTMVEGDITLLLAGVLAHGLAFGDYSFAQVLVAGTLGGVVSDNVVYWLGRGTRSRVQHYRFYLVARPRIERLTDKFGLLSIFVSKYTYGLRWAACAFYGVARMPYLRFLLLSFASCFVWVLSLTGAGYVFHTAINTLIGNLRDLSVYLLVIVVLIIGGGIAGFYFVERYLSKKVEEANPERLQKLEHAAEEKLQEIKVELKEILPKPLTRHKDSPKPGKVEADKKKVSDVAD